MSDQIRRELAEKLNRIRSIGREIAELRSESKKLRISLMCYHTSLPKRDDDDSCAMVVVDNVVAYLRPVTKPDSKQVIDAAVTFNDVFVASVIAYS